MSSNQTQAIANYVKKQAQQIATTTAFDLVTTGTIEEVHAGYYKIKLTNGENNIQYIAIPLVDTSAFSKGDFVYLLQAPVSSGSIQDKQYFIFGLVEAARTEYFNLTDWERFTANEIYTKIIKFGEDNNFSDTDEEENNIVSLIRTNRVFAIKADFSCTDDSIIDYYFEVKLLQSNTEENGSDIEVKTYKFNTEYFSGQPFNMDAVTQRFLATIDNDLVFDKIIITFKTEPDGAMSASFSNGELLTGTIEQDIDSFSVEISARDGKNYFLKEEENNITSADIDKIILDAKLMYKDKILDNKNLEYYWFIESKDAAALGRPGYLGTIEGDWWCINNKNIITTKEGKESLQWLAKNTNSFSIENSKNENSLFYKYINNSFILSAKCIIRYNQLIIHSQPLEILNYNKEEFDIIIESDTVPPIIYTDKEKIKLTCMINNKNPKDKTKYNYQYNWEGIKEGEEKAEILFSSAKIDSSSHTLTIADQNFIGEDASLVRIMPAINDQSYSFQCKVDIYKDKLDSVLTSEEKVFESKIKSIAAVGKISLTEQYRYIIVSAQEIITITYSQDEQDWIIQKTNDKGEIEKIVWLPSDGYYTNLQSLYTITLANNSYMYYSSRQAWRSTDIDNNIIGTKNTEWTRPIILRGTDNNGNELSSEVILKINTFNELTEYGQQDTLFYDYLYIPLTTEEINAGPISGVTYYIKNENNEYSKVNDLTVFEKDIQYFIYDKQIYMNATYIRSGVLEVPGKFRADMDNPDVYIGGFVINDNGMKVPENPSGGIIESQTFTTEEVVSESIEEKVTEEYFGDGLGSSVSSLIGNQNGKISFSFFSFITNQDVWINTNQSYYSIYKCQFKFTGDTSQYTYDAKSILTKSFSFDQGNTEDSVYGLKFYFFIKKDDNSYEKIDTIIPEDIEWEKGTLKGEYYSQELYIGIFCTDLENRPSFSIDIKKLIIEYTRNIIQSTQEIVTRGLRLDFKENGKIQSPYFYLDESGGKIAGWTITENSIFNKNTGLSSSNDDDSPMLWAGSMVPKLAPVRINSNGTFSLGTIMYYILGDDRILSIDQLKISGTQISAAFSNVPIKIPNLQVEESLSTNAGNGIDKVITINNAIVGEEQGNFDLTFVKGILVQCTKK